jgi:hypothetical protein
MKGTLLLFSRLKHAMAALVLCGLVPFFSVCDIYFGRLEGADVYATNKPPGTANPDNPANTDNPEALDNQFTRVLERMSGVWYSHYGAMRLDGYRIGKFGENGETFTAELGEEKLSLFPTNGRQFEAPYPLYQGGEQENYTPGPNDYYIFYDDTVYGEDDAGQGGNGGWEGLVTRYAGIVRAVNVFNNNEKTGALIVQYFQGCAPTWSAAIKDGARPFFGMYYRILEDNVIQMANAVELADLFAGKEYYTETATLQEAVEKNNAVNNDEFISWGVVWPQDRKQ